MSKLSFKLNVAVHFIRNFEIDEFHFWDSSQFTNKVGLTQVTA